MPFVWIVLVIIWWCFSIAMRSKKEAEAKAANQKKQPVPQRQPAANSPAAASPSAPMSRADEWEDEEDSWDRRDAMRGQKQPVAPTVSAQAKPVQSAAKKRHTAKPFETHMHTPVMGVQGEGTEGIDCCHDFMLSDSLSAEPAEFLPMQEEEQNERAKALLQGVIYSEILGRRPMRRYTMKQTRG